MLARSFAFALMPLMFASCAGGGEELIDTVSDTVEDIQDDGELPENAGDMSGSAEVTRLAVIDTVEGSGATAVIGREITVHYEGWLFDVNAPEFHGELFDSSLDREPYTFRLGSGDVIAGWDEGLVRMKVGGRRTLIVPAGLAYGQRGNGPIPPNAALVFDIELVNVN